MLITSLLFCLVGGLRRRERPQIERNGGFPSLPKPYYPAAYKPSHRRISRKPERVFGILGNKLPQRSLNCLGRGRHLQGGIDMADIIAHEPSPWHFEIDPEDACVYCGMPAGQVDHVHPKCASPLEANALTEKKLVPCCGECNRVASGHIYESLAQKREWVHRRLRKKYHRVLNLPHWTQAEIDELGPTLRRNLKADLARQKIARSRVNYKCDGRCRS